MIEQENVGFFCLTGANVEKMRSVLSSIVKTSLLLIIKTILEPRKLSYLQFYN